MSTLTDLVDTYNEKSHAKGQSYVIVLSCLHTLIYTDPAPKMGETLWCPRCRDYRPCAVAPPNYILHCDHGCKGTQLRREYGSAIVTAETRAVKHALRRTGHRVTLSNGDMFIREFYHPTLTVDVGEIPF